MRKMTVRAITAGLLLLGLAGPASADRRNFTYTYDWFTPGHNEKEVEFFWTQERGGEVDVELEFEYGVTDRYLVAPYLLLKREHGDKWEVEGFKLEQRYRFGDFKERRLLPALYFEVAKEFDESWEVEGKFITTYVTGPNLWSFNLIGEQHLEDGEPFEWGYSTGLSHLITGAHNARATWVGFETFGSFTEREYWAGPVVGHSLNQQTRVILTGALGLNDRSDTQVRLLFEHEWY